MFSDWATLTGLQAGMFGGATGNMWVAVVVGGTRVSCLSSRLLLVPFLLAESFFLQEKQRCFSMQRVYCKPPEECIWLSCNMVWGP